ncbi:hypothetical protein UlMin_020280 [Ulmus minor]
MAINTEVDKLLKANSIREENYPEWIANVVLVKKANGNWRVCVDFTDLNKACLKDSFPLPRIDQLVDTTAGHELLSFMDAYSGYNQIRMHQPDQEHTAFLIDQGPTSPPFQTPRGRIAHSLLGSFQRSRELGSSLASDLLEEKHDKAQLRATTLQQTVARHYNIKVKLRRFTKGDLVIRRIFLNTKEKGVGVLGPNWEGPYRV